jgi:uncharacterized membrane protein YgcG
MMKFVVTLFFSLFAALTAFARPQLHDLEIRVKLTHSGDAFITETRRMTIDSEGTECYIGMAHLDGSQVGNLRVSDETGRQYEYVEGWDIDRSRSWKAGKCGIVTTTQGYELCWGLGDSGERTYVTSYVVTAMVRQHPDADAIRFVFLDQAVSPKPEHAKVIICSDSLYFDSDSCGIWGFRFVGDLRFENGQMIAETTEAMNDEAGLYIMTCFKKGMFEPTVADEGTFEEKKAEAFSGSDYAENDGGGGTDSILKDIAGKVLGTGFIAMAVLPIFIAIWQTIKTFIARRRRNKELTWYREIPVDGNLNVANDIINDYKYIGGSYKNLLSASILKLIDMGAVSVEWHTNAKGKREQRFAVHDYTFSDRDAKLLKTLHGIFTTAAGDDRVLEPKELKDYMKADNHATTIDRFIDQLKGSTKKYKSKDFKAMHDDALKVFGLKKFLKDFTLMDERHLQEVSLWKEYMVWATLFGISDQVIKDMKKVNPEYFNMDHVAGQMADNMTLPMIYSTLNRSTMQYIGQKNASRSSGGGGHSSWGGGGGGFHGGGGGGGVR